MLTKKKKRIFDIIQIGYTGDFPSLLFDVVITVAILVNLFLAIFETFDMSARFEQSIRIVEGITVAGFTVEYLLRVWTAEYLYPRTKKPKAKLKYILSFSGIIDLLSFLPFYLPVFFPAGIVAFRMFRVIRILRLFRINAYYDALNVIGVYAADGWIRRYLSHYDRGAYLRDHHHVSGRGDGGDPYWYPVRRFCGAVHGSERFRQFSDGGGPEICPPAG